MISIFTPAHPKSARFLSETYQSLQAQSHQDWEWVIGLNGGATVPPEIPTDPRVRVLVIEDDDPLHNRIGRLKKICASQCRGDILVELDADDLLMPAALSRLQTVFLDSRIHMVYSNSTEFQDGTWENPTGYPYAQEFGWRHRPFAYEGHTLAEMISWEPGPHMMRRIWWAPNHVRAWRTESYKTLGGHDESIKTGDDHDLCCRSYLAFGAGGIHHIDECLYAYRVHDANSCRTANAEVQQESNLNYLRYLEPMAKRWAKDNGLRCLDLGGRLNSPGGYETVDLLDADIVADLTGVWPFADSSVGVIRAHHVLEHLPDSIHSMNEAFRVLAPGGFFLIEVPSTAGKGAWRDPTHKSFFVDQSFWYYCNQTYAKYIRPAFNGRFQLSRLEEYLMEPDVPVIAADLIALKPPYDQRPSGEVHI